MQITIVIDGHTPPAQLRLIAAAITAMSGGVTDDPQIPLVLQAAPGGSPLLHPPVGSPLAGPVSHAPPGSVQAGSALVGADVPEPTNPSPPTIDVDGFPWDERIHSGGKAVNNDGRWKKRKGVQEAVVTAVQAELKGTRASTMPPAPTPPVAPPVPIAPPAPPAPMVPSFPGAPGGAMVPATPAPMAPVAAAAPVGPPGLTFPEIMGLSQQCVNVGFSIEQMNQVAQEVGCQVFALVASKPAVWPTVQARLIGLLDSVRAKTGT